jgi:hypothetical protein
MEQQKLYHTLYRTTCTVTKKFYIGAHSTNDLEDEYFGSGLRLLRSIRKHGKDKHVKEVLEILDSKESMYIRENEVVNEELLQNPLCMNLKRGGEGGWSIEAQIKNNVASHQKQKWLSENDPEWKMRKSVRVSIGNAEALKAGRRKPLPDWTGRKMNQSHKDSIGKANSVSQKGEKNSQFGKVWITKENESVRVDKKDIETFLQNGWRKGRKTKFRH